MEKSTVRIIRNLLCAMLLLFCGTMNGQTNCASQPSGLVNWWKGDSNANDSIGTSGGTVTGTVSYSTGEVGSAFAFVNGKVNFGTNTANFGTNSFTVEFWLKTTAQVSESFEMAVMEKRPACNATLSFWGMRMGGAGTGGKLIVEASSNAAQNQQSIMANKLINDGVWHHVAFTRFFGTMSLYLDGTLNISQTNPATVYLSNAVGFVVGQGVCSCCSGTQPFSGFMDELSIYNRALSAAEILSVYNAGTYGKCSGSAPFITQQPTSITAQTNSMVGFSVLATGTLPLGYQWSFNSSPISGATTSSLTVTNVQVANAGSYSVFITNAFGSAQSSNAILTVTTGSGGGGGGTSTNCATISGLTHWWQAEGNAHDSVGTSAGTASTGISYTSGKVGQSFNFDGTSGEVDMDTSTGNFRTNDFTVEFWMQTSSSANMAVIAKREACDLDPSGWDIVMGYANGVQYNAGTIGFEVFDPTEADGPVVPNTTINDGLWHHVALTRAGTSVSMYLDGTMRTNITMASLIDFTNANPFQLGRNVCEGAAGIQPYQGLMDEISIYNRALSASEILAIYNADTFGKCGSSGGGSAPVITQQPTSITAQTNSMAGFSVLATGTLPLTYQWSFNSSTISGATNSSLTINPVQLTNAGTYSVFVTNAFGSAQSSNAILTVTTGGGGTSTNCASIPGLVNWWQAESNALDSIGTKNGTLSSGVSYSSGKVGQSFSFGGTGGVTMDTSTGNFRTNDFTVEFWLMTSSSQIMSIMSKRQVCNLNPAGWDILTGYANGVTYAAGTIGIEVFDSSGAWGPVVPNVTINDGLWHHFAMTRAGKLVTLYLDGTQRTNVTTSGLIDFTNAYPFELGLDVCGMQPYQGNLDEVAIFNRALSLSEIQSIYSSGYLGKCPPPPTGPSIVTQPTNVVVAVGSTLSLGVGATGTAPLTYNWIFNATNVYVTASSPLMITNVQLTNAGPYYVVVTNNYGSATSSNAVLVVGNAPGLTAQPQSQTALQFTPVTFNANATGTAPLAFQWLRNGLNIAQATNTSFTISSVQTTDAASYRVVVSNLFGTFTSSNAVLSVFTPNVRLENAALTVGPVTVPLRMVAGGSENSVSVSVNWPSNNLVYASTTLGSNAAGALMTVNTNQIPSGRLGVAVFFTDSSNFGIGTQELARITFRAGIVTNALTNALTFGDVPVIRQVVDTNFNTLVIRYSNSVVTMPVTDYEGDVSPRTNGNHTMGIADWTQAGRFVAGLDVVSNTLEFLRADCAPRTNGGDGRLSIADWVQAGRYAFGFDGIAAIGGPTNFTVAQTPKLPTRPVSLVLVSQNGLTNVVAVHLNAQGDENALGFSLSFDPTQLGYVSTTLGSGASGSVINVNSSQAASGHVGVALALTTGNNFAAGDIEVARVTFVSSGFGSYTAGVGFGDQPILREIADANATTESASYGGGNFTATGQPLPQLTAMLNNNTNIVLSWLAPSSGFNLESVTPIGTNWTPVVYTPATNGGNIVVTQAISVDQVFYRLRHP